jgi:UDPglucose 6-dehydrogenase
VALELAEWLRERGVDVRGVDPAIQQLPREIDSLVLASSVEEALDGADLVVVATPWPAFLSIDAELLVQRMRHPRVIDQAGFLPHLAGQDRLIYLRVGYPSKPVLAERGVTR